MPQSVLQAFIKYERLVKPDGWVKKYTGCESVYYEKNLCSLSLVTASSQTNTQFEPEVVIVRAETRFAGDIVLNSESKVTGFKPAANHAAKIAFGVYILFLQRIVGVYGSTGYIK
jgi:hypothetical protein